MPDLKRYYVRQRRPMWVCYVEEIDAEDADTAARNFCDGFPARHATIEGEVRHLDRGPVAVFDRADFPSPRDVVDAD